MSVKHVVVQGECIASIAFAHGFFPDTIWNDAANAELKALRGDPNVLLPGDVVVIPDKRSKAVLRRTGSMHVFRRRGVPEKLKLQFLRDGEPRAGAAYVLELDGVQCSGTTDAAGRIEQWIAPDAREGRIVFQTDVDEYRLFLGRLDPLDTISGVQSRLTALGHYDGPSDGVWTQETEEALQEFQAAHDLEPFGQLDDATRAALRAAYGG